MQEIAGQHMYFCNLISHQSLKRAMQCLQIYFDSYNLSPLVNSLVLHSFIQTYTLITVSRLAYRLQGTHSVVCGVYTIYFCYLVSHQSLKRAMQCLQVTFKKG